VEPKSSDERDEGDDCRVPASTALRTFPRFLDQRLDEGLELLPGDRVALIRRTRWGGDAHTVSIALLR
jgi:hypothetical protein